MTCQTRTKNWLRYCLSALVVLTLMLGQFGSSASSNVHVTGHGEMCGHMQHGEAQGAAGHRGSEPDLLAKSSVQPEPAKHCHDGVERHCASSCVVALSVNAQTTNYIPLADSPIFHREVVQVDGWLSRLERPPRT